MAGTVNARTEAILRRLVRRDAAAALRKVLSRTPPQDVAAAMEHMTWPEQRRLYDAIENMDVAAAVLSYLGDDSVREVTRDLTEDYVADLLDRMEPDDATDVVAVLPVGLRERVLAELDAEEDVAELLAWPPDSAGGIMSPEAFTMPDSATCGEAIRALQRVHDEVAAAYYLYVVDKNARLVGVVSLRALVVNPDYTPLVSIMTRDPIAVGPLDDQEEVARYVARYDLLSLPIVDEQRRVLGIVTVDDVVDVIRDEAAEDMLRMAGLTEDAMATSRSLLRQVRQRAGWLLATIGGGVLASEIIVVYEHTLAQVAVLAGFIPVIMGMGGNVGIQSATIAVRGLATGHVQVGGAVPFLIRELRIGFLLGVLFGFLLAAYGFLRFGDEPLIGVSIGVSIGIALTSATVVGAAIPIALSRLRVDPAVATGPLVTTVVDLLGIIVYFSVARFLLDL